MTELNKARQRLKDITNFDFQKGITNNYKPVKLVTEHGQIELPTYVGLWDNKSVDGLKMFYYNDEIKNYILCVALRDIVVEKHQHIPQTESIYMITGDAEDLETDKIIKQGTVYVIPSGQWHTIKFKKGSVCLVTFEPKIEE